MPTSAPPPSPGSPAALRVLVDLARRLHAASAGRIVLGITGSPGAGKTNPRSAATSALAPDEPLRPERTVPA